MTRNRFETADWLTNWLDENHAEQTNFGDLSDESGFEVDELRRSAEMLQNLGLINFDTDWGQMFFRGRLTGAGQHLVYSGKSVKEIGLDQGSHTTNTAVNVHGDIHGGQVGINNEHSVTINVSTAQIQHLIDALRENGHDDVAEVINQQTDGGDRTNNLPAALRNGLSMLGDAGSATTILGPVATALMGLF